MVNSRKRIISPTDGMGSNSCWLMLANLLLFSARKFDVQPGSKSFRVACHLVHQTHPKLKPEKIVEVGTKIAANIKTYDVDDRYVYRTNTGMPLVDMSATISDFDDVKDNLNLKMKNL